jgi:hypothetical protein
MESVAIFAKGSQPFIISKTSLAGIYSPLIIRQIASFCVDFIVSKKFASVNTRFLSLSFSFS